MHLWSQKPKTKFAFRFRSGDVKKRLVLFTYDLYLGLGTVIESVYQLFRTAMSAYDHIMMNFIVI